MPDGCAGGSDAAASAADVSSNTLMRGIVAGVLRRHLP